MTRAKDPELKAIGVCVDALLTLDDDDALERVLTYLNERFLPGTYPALAVATGSFELVDKPCTDQWHKMRKDNPIRLRECPSCGMCSVPMPAPPTDGVVG